MRSSVSNCSSTLLALSDIEATLRYGRKESADTRPVNFLYPLRPFRLLNLYRSLPNSLIITYGPENRSSNLELTLLPLVVGAWRQSTYIITFFVNRTIFTPFIKVTFHFLASYSNPISSPISSRLHWLRNPIRDGDITY